MSIPKGNPPKSAPAPQNKPKQTPPYTTPPPKKATRNLAYLNEFMGSLAELRYNG